MQTIVLYRYARTGGGITVSPEPPEDGVSYALSYRLIAAAGHSLSNNQTYAQCVDTDTPDAWHEVVGDANDELSDTAALNILLGGADV